jgi:hypothetical protein
MNSIDELDFILLFRFSKPVIKVPKITKIVAKYATKLIRAVLFFFIKKSNTSIRAAITDVANSGI